MGVQNFDVAVIGAGIAGASLASRLPPALRTVLVEAEDQPGYHSTGRSAAIFSETYGSPSVRALSRASRPFLLNPPAQFADNALLRRCGVLFIARADQCDRLNEFAALPDVANTTRHVSSAEAHDMLPVLKPGYVAAALIEPEAAEIDVHALHQGFLKQARANGSVLLTGAPVCGLTRSGGRWLLETKQGHISAGMVVNAAGAWADEIALMAGASPIGLQPLRRTALVVDAPEAAKVDHWPMTVDIDEQFYLKPDAGRILISPADETPSPPCDAQPDEYDLAVAVDRIETATTLRIRHIQGKWAGLRSFAPDRSPAIGYDPAVAGFFWLAGQGGYGIQTSLGAAELGAALLQGKEAPSRLADLGLRPSELSPSRFALPAAASASG